MPCRARGGFCRWFACCRLQGIGLGFKTQEAPPADGVLCCGARRFGGFPQELVLRLHQPARLLQLQLLSHESKVRRGPIPRAL